MFTGLIECAGTVSHIGVHENGREISVECPTLLPLALGESISLDGMCVTVSRLQENGFFCDISKESLRVTKTSTYQVGDMVNLEKSLRIGDSLGGHFVLGHVDKVGEVLELASYGRFYHLRIQSSRETSSYLVPKGSIAVDGVSLTINETNLNTGSFEVMLIPHTYQNTNLCKRKAGDLVNLEFDYLAKVVSHLWRLQD